MIIIDDFEEEVDRKRFEEIIKNNEDIIIFKFGAEWCNPCKVVKPYIEENINDINTYMETEKIDKKVYFYEIIVDDYFDLYAMFKQKKMINGIPHIMCFFGENNLDRSHFYIPDFSVSGANKNSINLFFKSIKDKL